MNVNGFLTNSAGRGKQTESWVCRSDLPFDEPSATQSRRCSPIHPLNGTATVNFQAHNVSSISSATHPPVIGYTSFWNQYIGTPLNNLFQSGPMSPTVQNFNWTETIPVPKPHPWNALAYFSVCHSCMGERLTEKPRSSCRSTPKRDHLYGPLLGNP